MSFERFLLLAAMHIQQSWDLQDSCQIIQKAVDGAAPTFQVNMSVAVIPMAEELGWSASDRGLVSSAFFWGYSATQVPAGYLSTK